MHHSSKSKQIISLITSLKSYHEKDFIRGCPHFQIWLHHLTFYQPHNHSTFNFQADLFLVILLFVDLKEIVSEHQFCTQKIIIGYNSYIKVTVVIILKTAIHEQSINTKNSLCKEHINCAFLELNLVHFIFPGHSLFYSRQHRN